MLLDLFLNMAEKTQPLSSLWQSIKRYVSLNVANAKLSATEKLTMLFAAIAFYFVAILLGAVALIFVSMSISEVLSQSLPIHYVYLIMAAFYLFILIIVCLFRKALFLNPIARFLSRIMLNPPKENN